MAELIEMPFVGLTWVGPVNHTLDGVEIPPREVAILEIIWPTEEHWECMLQCMQQKGSLNCQ